MFRKIVSNLPFSPALVGQLGFYAKRLRQEEATRRIGLIFTVLALIVQSFAVFSPPEPANAASPSDFVRGGVSSLNEYLSYYDRNSNNIKDIMNATGITRQEISAAVPGSINSRGVLSWGMTSYFSAAQGERAYNYPKNGGGTGTVFYRPLSAWDSTPYTLKNGSTYDAYIGNSARMGWFAIMKVCGNLVTNKSPVQPTPQPQPQPRPLPQPQPQPRPQTQPQTQPAPAAACSVIKAIVSNRTLVQLTGQATTSGGATISSYNFTVKDKSGATVASQTVNSTALSAAADNIVLSTPGTYSATLSVATSVGEKSGAACQQSFTIAPPATCAYNPSLPASSPQCQPCQGDSSMWINDSRCNSKLVLTKTATNFTQGGADATTTIAQASDKIVYRLNLANNGLAPVTAPIVEQLTDVIDYAGIVDSGGGVYNKEASTLTWPDVTLQPGQQQTRIFVVQLASSIPAVARGISNPASYDCVITNTFGNSVSINVNCPAPKQVEQVVAELPKTGPGANTLFAGIVFSVVVYFYARSRQLKTEVRLIRRDLHAGTI